MSVAVLIPWRPGCLYRQRALEYVKGRYEAARYPVAVGVHKGGSWCKAKAVAAALDATNAEVVVLADADVWCDNLPEALQALSDGFRWSIPHRSVHRLDERSTALYQAGAGPETLTLSERAYAGVEGGGIVVIRREDYEACPLDPRFTGWGQEDEAWGFALRCLYGPPWRPTRHAPLWHCWHPPPERMTRARGNQASWHLRVRYARARHDPDAMRRLIEEGRHDTSTVQAGRDTDPTVVASQGLPVSR